MPRRSHHVSRGERYETTNLALSFQRGTRYPCQEYDLRNLDNPTAPMARLFDNSFDFHYALRKLQALHQRPPSDIAFAALRRLERLHSLEESGQWWADLPFKIFADCDIGLFNGRLRGMVFLQWFDPREEPENQHLEALTSTPQYSNDQYWGGPRIRIALNRDALLLRGSLSKVVDAVVHEMIHVWFNLLTPYGDDPDGHNHGESTYTPFIAIMYPFY